MGDWKIRAKGIHVPSNHTGETIRKKGGIFTKLTSGMKKLDKVLKTVDLVDYQDGAIVSKTIIEKNTGTVTLFAFDQGQKLSEHTVPYDALVDLLDGESEITISGKNFLLKEGEMIIMPANEPHALRAVSKFKMILTMIK